MIVGATGFQENLQPPSTAIIRNATVCSVIKAVAPPR
jgi:hypothetical protein